MFTTTSSAAAVQAVMTLPFILFGLSHIVQPNLWREFFGYLHGLGATGVVIRTFALELVPATVIVTFHQVWSGVPVALTIYGWLLMIKITLSMLVPSIGLRSLGMSDTADGRGFVVGGIVLLGLGGVCIWGLHTTTV
ncbi:MAG: hypothetical protein AAGA61_06110 [Pseudomonadota bacterium]